VKLLQEEATVMKKLKKPEAEKYSTERIKLLTLTRIRHTPPITMNRRPLKNLGALAVAAAVIALSAVTVFALTYKRPADVAKEMNAPVLAEMFEAAAVSEAKAAETLSENEETTEVIKQAEINESITSGKYTFTLLGMLTSDEIAELQSSIRPQDKGYTYAVVAIAYADGTPFENETHYNPLTEDDNFTVAALLTGIAPADGGVMWHGAAQEQIFDGIIYQIRCIDDVEIFADKGVKLVINTSGSVGNDPYHWDETMQDYVINPEFEGAVALFDLPLDKSKGDPEKAAKYFADLKAERENPAPLPPEIQADLDKWAGIQKDSESIDWTDAHLIEGMSDTFTPDENGVINYKLFSEEIGGMSGSYRVSDLFPDGKPVSVVHGGGYSAMSPEDAIFRATRYTLNEDGTVTVEYVSPNVKNNPHITKYPAYSDNAE
jgi:hypothetical protein